MKLLSSLQIDESLKELFFCLSSSPANTISMDAILENLLPGTLKHFGSVDARPEIEGYFVGCELFAYALKAKNREHDDVFIC